MENTDNLIKAAFKEDFNNIGDVTSDFVFESYDFEAEGFFIAKQSGVVAGLDIVRRCFELYDEKVEFESLCNEGDYLADKAKIAKVKGNLKSLLAVERTALNFLGHLSGIATLTRKYVEAVKHYKAKILDTRKTIPGLRELEKYAVKVGGGTNHRFGLYDLVLIKDNHKDFLGIRKSIENGKKSGLKVEVEVENLDELKEALEAKPDVIMLDNMGVSNIKEAVNIAVGIVKLEASGNISLENIIEIAATGVDYISIGALTHSAQTLDISFKIKEIS